MSKTYLNGSAKEVVFNDGGSLINVWIDLDDAKEKGLIKKTKTGKNGIAMTIAKRSEEGKYGDTHYMYYKEMDGGGSKKPVAKKATPKTVSNDEPTDDLPF